MHRTVQNILLIFLLAGIFISCKSKAEDTVESAEIRKEFKQLFVGCPDYGSIAIYDNTNHKWFLSDTTNTQLATLPASTFKIINFLIALEIGVVNDENDVVKWISDYDTIKYGHRPDIYHDMTIEEAFKASAGWVFIELAKKIGRDNYLTYLDQCEYGNGVLTQEDFDFWNFGDFGITPINQVEFLKKLYDEDLPFSKRNIEIVKRVMINEQNEQYTLRAKTGWTRDSGMNTGWWVGYIENKTSAYFFATRLLRDRSQSSKNFGSCRKEITKKALKELDIL